MTGLSLDPLLGAPTLVQLHAVAGLLALVLGGLRLAWTGREPVERGLGWSFLGLLVVAAGSSLLLTPPDGAVRLLGVTPHHGFAVLALAGAGAAVVAAGYGKRLARQRIMTATFAGVLLMAGLFEMIPGRLLNAVLAGG
jgi:uncharacterized membrane protein